MTAVVVVVFVLFKLGLQKASGTELSVSIYQVATFFFPHYQNTHRESSFKVKDGGKSQMRLKEHLALFAALSVKEECVEMDAGLSGCHSMAYTVTEMFKLSNTVQNNTRTHME